MLMEVLIDEYSVSTAITEANYKMIETSEAAEMRLYWESMSWAGCSVLLRWASFPDRRKELSHVKTLVCSFDLWRLCSIALTSTWFERASFWSRVRYATAASHNLFDASQQNCYFWQFYLRLYVWLLSLPVKFQVTIHVHVCLFVRHYLAEM